MSQLMKQFSISFLVLAAASCTSEPITKSWVFVSKAPSVSTPLVTQDRIFFGSDVGLDGSTVWAASFGALIDKA